MICGSGIELYTLTISCGPGSVIGRASGGEESTTNKPLVLEITQSIRESVDSLCRDGADLPIVRVHRKAFITRERSRSKPFCAPSYSIPAFLYPKIPPK